MKTDFHRIIAMTLTVGVGQGRKILVGVGLLFCCSALFSGCMVEFTNTPADPRHATADRNLLGRWSGVDEKGNPGFIQFDKAGSEDMAVSIFGKNSDLGYSNPVFRVTTTRMGPARYLVLRGGDSGAKSNQTIAKYAIAGNKLKIWVLSAEKIKEAIRSGQLQGTVGLGLEDGVVVSSSTKDVVRFIEHARDDLFSLIGEFQKVAP